METLKVNMEAKHEEATEFEKKMDELIKKGVAKNYVDAGLLVELGEKVEGDLSQVEKKIKDLGSSLESAAPIKEIICRQSMVRDLAEKMRTEHKPILLKGIWRTGNTSVMDALAKEMGLEEENILRLNITGADYELEETSFSEFLKEDQELVNKVSSLIGSMEGKSFKEYEEIEKEIEASGLEPLEYLDQYLSKAENAKKVLLMIDESTTLLEHPEALQEMNKWGNLKNIMVIANIHRIGSSGDTIKEALSNFEQVPVGVLTLDETKRMARVMMPDVYQALSDDGFKQIYSATGGRPYEIVMLCMSLKENYSDDQSLESLIEEMTGPSSPEWNYLADMCYSRIKEYAFSDTEKGLIRDILENEETSVEGYEGLGEDLVSVGILKKEKSEGKEVYQINGTALESYLKREMQD